MSDTILTHAERAGEPAATARHGLLTSRRGRQFRETLLAYTFLAPALIIIFIFGLFPLAFSAFESTLRALNNVLGRYDGLGNYVRAIDDLAYVLAFWLALAAVVFAVYTAAAAARLARERGDTPWLLALPAAVTAVFLALATRFTFVLLPALLAIPEMLRGQVVTRELFLGHFGEAIRSPAVRNAFLATLAALLLALLLTYLTYRAGRGPRHDFYYGKFVQTAVLIIAGLALGWLTWTEVRRAYEAAWAAGDPIDIWTQVTTISAGLVLLLLSWLLWRSASGRGSNLSVALRLMAASALMVGAWFLIGHLPAAVASGDRDWWTGLLATVYYSVGTIPVQLVLSLFLAVLLFQNIRGKGLFRIIYFLPYIAPFVGTAAAFRILFSGRANAPMNSVLTATGVDPLRWLNEPAGVFQLLAGPDVVLPQWAAGPSLALVVIMLYGIWSFFGFNVVVFLAGLGSIPGELHEAAAIDGAGRWAQFRHVTLPLLSPTIYFLTLWATIGTFKAFNHIYVLRQAAALGTTDTASIVIFQAFKRDTRFGYASALAILLLLVILLITFVNNRYASRKVFYG